MGWDAAWIKTKKIAIINTIVEIGNNTTITSKLLKVEEKQIIEKVITWTAQFSAQRKIIHKEQILKVLTQIMLIKGNILVTTDSGLKNQCTVHYLKDQTLTKTLYGMKRTH